MTPEQKRLDKYYLKKFGWSLAEVDALFESQGNVCAACLRPPGERRMSLDHDHAFDRIKITTRKLAADLWEVSAKDEILGVFARFVGGSKTKKRLRELVRIFIRRKSVRAGLCLRCNKGLAMFEDSKAPLPPAERLERLAQVLRRFKGKSDHEANSAISSSNPVVFTPGLDSHSQDGCDPPN